MRPMEVSKGNVKGVAIFDKEGKKIGVEDVTFLRDSYIWKNQAGEDIGGLKVSMGIGDHLSLVDHLKRLGVSDKDTINDETCDLLIPYERALNAGWFTGGAAYNNCRPLKDIYNWCFAMKDYHEKSVKVQPLVARN
jgi:hypothetical protein